MAFDWREYVTIAGDLPQLQTSSSIEAKQRCAVSRAYYGVYCNTRNYAIQKLNYVSTARQMKWSEHKDLRVFLHNRGGNLIKAASDLERLHGLRKRCDYNDTVSRPTIMYTEALKLAKSIMAIVP